MTRLNGTWKGFYEYGLGYGLPHFGKRVEMVLELQMEHDNITGSIIELPSKYAVNSTASIKGFIDTDLISFVKTYPVLPEIDTNGLIQIKSGSLDVNHSGTIDYEQQTMYGLWTIEQNEVTPYDINNPLQSEGIWLLEKQ